MTVDELINELVKIQAQGHGRQSVMYDDYSNNQYLDVTEVETKRISLDGPVVVLS